MHKNFKRIGIPLISMAVISTTTSMAESAVVANKYNCVLKVDVAHLSTNALQKGRGNAVKVKARTTCDGFQDRTQISLRIFKEGLFADHGSAVFLLTTERKHGFVVEHKTAEIPCVNGRLTKFYGEATAVINIKGTVTKLGPSYSDFIVPLCCGT
jgi:hypothetical protein